ncbi:hypothetical protein R8510_05253 [Ralstonia chuxiongensis]|nr:hypothetical protein R8510_05253 [Ralstonia chuxiongensis]
MMIVSVGSFCLVLANTLTTCGTTYDSRKITIANATTVTMAGYVNASLILEVSAFRLSM